jgi:dUTPase
MLITVPHNYFRNINDSSKAYLAGYFTSINCNIEEYLSLVTKININYNKNITIHKKLMSILSNIHTESPDPMDNMSLFIEYDNNNKQFECTQQIMSFDRAESKKLIYKIGLPNNFQDYYYRGMVDANFISMDSIEINSMNNESLSQFAENTKIPYIKNENSIQYITPNTIDLFYNIYQNTTDDLINTKTFKYFRNDPDAQLPYKARASDSGYDLTLIKLIKKINNVEFYDTGISVEPPHNMYFDLVGRSSISKTGYMLANNIGIIDQSYRGNIIVPLIKIDSQFPNLELPVRLVQIIPRYIEHLIPIESYLSESDRHNLGFGSTNK